MLEALNSIVDFISLFVDLISSALSYFPILTQIIFKSIFPFLTYKDLLPVYFYPFISFTAGGTLLLMILNRRNNRG